MAIPVGLVRIAEDADFKKFKEICDTNEGWKLEVNKNKITVWTKANELSNFHMVKIQTEYDDLPAPVLYDVIHDPDYRKTWDHSMIEGREICVINPNNDIGYYSIKCPPPLKNRDFVTQRSWLDTGSEYAIFNHSVNHALSEAYSFIKRSLSSQKQPPKKGIVRGISFLTGYYIRHLGIKGCQLTYVSQSDPKGSLPAWAINKLTHILAPKVINRVYKAAKNYPTWKSKNRPEYKPWLNAEQMMTDFPRFDPKDVRPMCLTTDGSSESLDEENMCEEDMHDEDL